MRVIMTQPGTSPRWGWAVPTSEWSPARVCDGADHQVNMLSAQAANAARVPKFFTVSSFLVLWFLVLWFSVFWFSVVPESCFWI